MRRTMTLLLGCLLLAGCAKQDAAAPTSEATEETPALGESAESPNGQTPAEENPGEPTLAEADDPTPAEPARTGGAAIDSGKVTLTPENAKIQFVGSHTDKSKDDRVGTFGQFSGAVEVDPDSGALKSISIEIDADSVETEFPKLTNHLKSADFLEVREYPTLSFESTDITADGDSTYMVTGMLKLHGAEQEISFPATVGVEDGLSLTSEFVIDRTEFGMNFGVENVEKEVSITVTVGGGA